MLVLAALLLAGCTFSDSLRVNEIRSVWGPSAKKLPPVPVFFATDRELDGGAFTLHWGGAAHCGKADVAVANALSPPTQDPKLVPIACEGAGAIQAFVQAIAAAAKAQGCNRVLVIVHGYNVSFRSALLHGAQSVRDVQWPCPSLLLNWSSEAKFNRYAADIERSGYAVPLLIGLLRELHAQGLQADILAHSMGNRIAMTAMGALCADRQIAVGQFILVSADIGIEPGNDDFAKMLMRGAPCAQRVTIYASDNDLALILSESIHGGIPRAGRAPRHDMDYAGPAVDVVDASDAPGDPAGHAYFIFSWEMASDLMWVLDGAPLAKRAGPGGTLACSDWNGTACATGGGRYSLVVAEDRRPGWVPHLLRWILPLTPLQ